VVLGHFDAGTGEVESENKGAVVAGEPGKAGEEEPRKWRMDIKEENLFNIGVHKISKKGLVEEGIRGMVQANESEKHTREKEQEEKHSVQRRIVWGGSRCEEIETVVFMGEKVTSWI
jgi:hypothetical protein